MILHTLARTHTHTKEAYILVYYANLPTGLCTINFTIEFITSVLYKISPMLLQALKSYPLIYSDKGYRILPVVFPGLDDNNAVAFS